MSASVVIEQSEKKRIELQNELTLLEQKMQTMTEEIRKLDEALTAKLVEKIKEKKAAFEKLESQIKDMQMQLEELQDKEAFRLPILCQNCGAENIPNANFCERCGKQMKAAINIPQQ